MDVGSKEKTQQGIFNNERMKLCMNTELQHKIIHCKKCGSTGIMVGIEQMKSDDSCYSCFKTASNKNT